MAQIITFPKFKLDVPRDHVEATAQLNRQLSKWQASLEAVATAVSSLSSTAGALSTQINSVSTMINTITGPGGSAATNPGGGGGGSGGGGGGGGGGGTGAIAISFFVEPIGASPFSLIANSWSVVLASASSSADFILNLPASIGTGGIVTAKKMDAFAHNIAVTPNGSDTIDGVNAATNISLQYDTVRFIDYGLGTWAIW